MSVGVVLLQPESVIGGESLSQIAGRGSMLQAPSHASDGATKSTWLRHDVSDESCSRWRCRGDLVVALLMTMLT
jgi:hypothetical protein